MLDIAVVQLDAGDKELRSLVIGGNGSVYAQPGDELTVIGWDSMTGYVNMRRYRKVSIVGENSFGARAIHLDDAASIAPGYSGGLVLDTHNMAVGMFTSRGADDAYVVPIADIEQLIQGPELRELSLDAQSDTNPSLAEFQKEPWQMYEVLNGYNNPETYVIRSLPYKSGDDSVSDAYCYLKGRKDDGGERGFFFTDNVRHGINGAVNTSSLVTRTDVGGLYLSRGGNNILYQREGYVWYARNTRAAPEYSNDDWIKKGHYLPIDGEYYLFYDYNEDELRIGQGSHESDVDWNEHDWGLDGKVLRIANLNGEQTGSSRDIHVELSERSNDMRDGPRFLYYDGTDMLYWDDWNENWRAGHMAILDLSKPAPRWSSMPIDDRGYSLTDEEMETDALKGYSIETLQGGGLEITNADSEQPSLTRTGDGETHLSLPPFQVVIRRDKTIEVSAKTARGKTIVEAYVRDHQIDFLNEQTEVGATIDMRNGGHLWFGDRANADSSLPSDTLGYRRGIMYCNGHETYIGEMDGYAASGKGAKYYQEQNNLHVGEFENGAENGWGTQINAAGYALAGFWDGDALRSYWEWEGAHAAYR